MMRKLFSLSLLCMLFGVTIVAAQLTQGSSTWGTVTPDPVINPVANEPETSITTMELDKKHYNLGEIVKGDKIKYQIGFTNTGTENLILETVKPSCSCSTPTWSSEPVLPGAKGLIEVLYNTEEKMIGPAEGTITIVYNGIPNIEQITFEAVIKEGTPTQVEFVPKVPEHSE